MAKITLIHINPGSGKVTQISCERGEGTESEAVKGAKKEGHDTGWISCKNGDAHNKDHITTIRPGEPKREEKPDDLSTCSDITLNFDFSKSSQ